MTKNEIFKRLDREAELAGKTKAEFVAELDKAAHPRIGLAYAYGLVTSAYTQVHNKETVCRYIRQWKKINRAN